MSMRAQEHRADLGSMQLLLLIAGLSLLLSALGAKKPPLTPASAEELLGKWFIIRWVGDTPIPASRVTDPLPPFWIERNSLNELNFRINISFGECDPMSIHLEEFLVPGAFFSKVFGYFICINFLPGKEHAVASYKGMMYETYYQMKKLIGRTLDEDPDALRMFEEYVEWKGLNRTEIIKPPFDDSCELASGS